MKNGKIDNIEPIYYIKAFLEDDNKKIISCFLGIDNASERGVDVVGSLRLHIFDNLKQDLKEEKDQKVRFFLNAVFFKDRKIAEELLEQYVEKTSSCLNARAPIVEEMARYKDIPLQIIERIGSSNGFIKETVYFGKKPVGYRLTIK